jgi:hypothetical protein
MPKIKFTKEDLLSRNQLAPGWRKLKCKSIEEGPGKKDPTSTVWECMFIISEGKEMGQPIRHWFSEKAMDRLVDYVKGFTKAEENKEYELNDTVGREIMGYCLYDDTQGWNVIKDWKPVQTAVGGTK